MHKTKTGRWQPDSKPKTKAEPGPFGPDGELRMPEWMAGVPAMPWWYPLMHFEAAVGREVLRQDEEA